MNLNLKSHNEWQQAFIQDQRIAIQGAQIQEKNPNSVLTTGKRQRFFWEKERNNYYYRMEKIRQSKETEWTCKSVSSHFKKEGDID